MTAKLYKHCQFFAQGGFAQAGINPQDFAATLEKFHQKYQILWVCLPPQRDKPLTGALLPINSLIKIYFTYLDTHPG